MCNTKLTRVIATIIVTTFIFTQSGIAMPAQKAQNLRAKATGETDIAGAVAEALATGNKDVRYRTEGGPADAFAAGDVVKKALQDIEKTIYVLGDKNSLKRVDALYKIADVIENDSLIQVRNIQSAIAVQVIPALRDNLINYKNSTPTEWVIVQNILVTITEKYHLAQVYEIQTAITETISKLIDNLSHKESVMRRVLENILTGVAKSDNLTRLPYIQTAIASAIPGLIDNFSHKNSYVRLDAQNTLTTIIGNDNLTGVAVIQTAMVQAMPVLRSNLVGSVDGGYYACKVTLHTLRTIAENSNLTGNPKIQNGIAEQILPSLIANLSNEKDYYVRQLAQYVLTAIAENNNLTRHTKIQSGIAQAVLPSAANLSDKHPFVKQTTHYTLKSITESNNLMASSAVTAALSTKQLENHLRSYLKDKLTEGIAKQDVAVIISTDSDEIADITRRLMNPENGLGFQTVNIHSFDSLEKARNFINNNNNNNNNVLIVINKIKTAMQELQNLMPACEISGDVLSNVPQTAAEIHTWL